MTKTQETSVYFKPKTWIFSALENNFENDEINVHVERRISSLAEQLT